MNDRVGRPRLILACAAISLPLFASACETSTTNPLPVRIERTAGIEPCDVPRELLVKVKRGFYPGRSGDVLTIEWAPNQFAGIRHSTPWPYTQNVPLVLYGPGSIREGMVAERTVTVADLAPTWAELLRFDAWPQRDGRVLEEALVPGDRGNVPQLLVTLVWDGGGDDLLEQWPDAWPHLRELMARGTSFTQATAGSSPSITPPIHASIGTGAYPWVHGQTDMYLRIAGAMRFVWEDVSPRFLRVATLGDLWDRETGNRALVGAIARDSYHLGMLGHGAAFKGGDRDIAIIDKTEEIGFNDKADEYRIPPYIHTSGDLEEAIETVDLRDGTADASWLGNPLSSTDPAVRATPAWPIYQTEVVKALVEEEGFGDDRVPDLLYLNYKSTDLAGHAWNLVEPEERDVLEEQDKQLAELIEFLDRTVGSRNYVLAVTADHGISPDPATTGGWSISGDEVVDDIHAAFDRVDPDAPLVTLNRGYQVFLDREQLKANDVTPEDISAFLRDYRVEDNVASGEIPPLWSERSDERLFITALTPAELDEALECSR